jgi:hypothetical protein
LRAFVIASSCCCLHILIHNPISNHYSTFVPLTQIIFYAVLQDLTVFRKSVRFA